MFFSYLIQVSLVFRVNIAVIIIRLIYLFAFPVIVIRFDVPRIQLFRSIFNRIHLHHSSRNNLLCGAGNLANCALHASNMKIQYTECKMNKYSYSCMYVCFHLCILQYTLCNKDALITIRKTYKYVIHNVEYQVKQQCNVCHHK